MDVESRDEMPAGGDAPSGRLLLGLEAGEFQREVGTLLETCGEPGYRLRQVRDWVYRRSAASFEQMSDLPARLRAVLETTWELHPLRVQQRFESADGTEKFLWRLGSDETRDSIESVLIPDGKRVTYCISTQAGCPAACTFCATGHGGFRGQLDAAEIVDQVLSMRRLAARPPTNIVYMGMGEPLLNYGAVRASIRILTQSEQVGFGARRITVSTVGIPRRIRDLARHLPQVKLALSLHAADDATRDAIIPLNRKYPLAEVLQAVREHAELTGKKATFEYIVLPGVNDSEPDARALAVRARPIPSRINLIAFNPFAGAPYRKPSIRRVLRFRDWLRSCYGGDVTVRRSRGEDIQGACGQLRASRPEAEKPPAPGREKKETPGGESRTRGQRWEEKRKIFGARASGRNESGRDESGRDE